MVDVDEERVGLILDHASILIVTFSGVNLQVIDCLGSCEKFFGRAGADAYKCCLRDYIKEDYLLQLQQAVHAIRHAHTKTRTLLVQWLQPRKQKGKKIQLSSVKTLLPHLRLNSLV